MIVVARAASGTSFASGHRISSDLVLHVDRVLKGDVTQGSEIGAHLAGRGYFMAADAKPRKVTETIYGIWFLNRDTGGYSVVSRNGDSGELSVAPVLLRENAPPGNVGSTPAESVLNEIASGLRWLASKQTAIDQMRTLDASTTPGAFQQFAQDPSPLLRVVGIRGLIAANDPEGIKLAASEWEELSGSADVQPIIEALTGYSNDAVRALGTLAVREAAGSQMRQNASYALRGNTHQRRCAGIRVAARSQR